MQTLSRGLFALMLLPLLATSARAIIVPGGNGTNRPPDPFNLARYTGLIGDEVFLGTPIAPKYLVTAAHLSNPQGKFFFNNGTSTRTTYNVALAGTLNDLAIWRITDDAEFSLYAPIYTRSDEVGQPLVTFGSGIGRSTEVRVNGELRGWRWGGAGARGSWGTNTVADIVNITPELAGAPLAGFLGEHLYFTFDRETDTQGNLLNPNEGIFTTGDSGGPTFVLDPTDGVYKLAGINGLVDTVSQTPNGSPFFAGLYDARGFYAGPDLITGSDPVPLGSYATRLSSRALFIQNVTGLQLVPEPGAVTGWVGLLTLGGSLLLRRQRSSKRLRHSHVA